MRSIRTLFASSFALLATLAIAQVPQAFSYQAVARDANGDALASHALDVQFQLHQGSALGSVVYAESHSTTTNDHGLFTLQVGSGAPSTGTFSAVDWRSGPYFLEVLMDASSSGVFTSMGTQQLLSVPYALYAANSNLPDGTEVGQIGHWTGTTWAVDSGLYVSDKRFGIGINTPEAPLSVKSRDHLYEKFQDGDIPTGEDFLISSGGGTGLSFDQETPDGAASRLFIQNGTGHIGIGTQDPPAALAVVSSTVLKTFFQTGDFPTQNDFGIGSDSAGLSIDQGIPGSMESRMFFDAATGNVGINETLPSTTLHVSRDLSDPSATSGLQEGTGIAIFGPITDHIVADYRGLQARHGEYVGGSSTVTLAAADLNLQPLGGRILIHEASHVLGRSAVITDEASLGLGTMDPTEKLHLQDSVPDGMVGMRILNTATAANQGFTFGHRHKPGSAQDGALLLFEDLWPNNSDLDFNDLVVLPGGNIGINEEIPDTKLHVTRDPADPLADVDLIEGTGIVVFGPIIGNNLGFDAHQIQARTGSIVPGSTTLSLSASPLGLQPLGGDIRIHSEDAVLSNQVTITGDGKIGVGKEAIERVDINGAIRIGDTQSASAEDGTIRWTGTDFEGRKAGTWKSLTTHTNTDDLWQADPTGEIHFSPPGGGAKVSLNLPAPKVTMRVDSWAAIVERSTGAVFQNTVTTTSTDPADNRVGVEIKNNGTWGGSPDSKNIGLYVSEVSGQTAASSNLAAVINGNVVIGDVAGSQAVGTGGTNVLAIQNGAAPASPPSSSSGLPDAGVQLYSTGDATGTSVFHLMNGDGTVIQLYRAPALIAADASPLGPGVDPSTAALIDNMRSRINELEARLQTLGLLTP